MVIWAESSSSDGRGVGADVGEEELPMCDHEFTLNEWNDHLKGDAAYGWTDDDGRLLTHIRTSLHVSARPVPARQGTNYLDDESYDHYQREAIERAVDGYEGGAHYERDH